MFHVAFEYLWVESRLETLNSEAENQITTRGYGSTARIPSDLSDRKWFLSVNDIAYDYCPTNRYLYLRKVLRKSQSMTWRRYKGKVLDELIPAIYDKIYDYAINTNIRNIQLPNDIMHNLEEIIRKMKKEFDPRTVIDPPPKNEINKFYDDLLKLAKYEAIMVSSFLNNRISNIFEINIKTEFKILFPFDFKLKIKAPELGISGSAEIDFVLKQNILGEIKSQEWYDFYNIGLAAYALAYEHDRKRNVNLGVIICPTFNSSRTVPIYNNTANIKIIDEHWRKIFITKRNQKIELIRNANDPGLPDDYTKCKGCGFYNVCW